MQIPFATQAYRLKSLPASAQRCVNFYAEKQPQDAKSPIIVYGSPGMSSVVSVGTGPIRGMRVMNNVLYVVSGQDLYAVDQYYHVTLLGTGIVGFGYVPMEDNGVQVCIVNGIAGYIYDTSTSTFGQIIDPNFYPANTATFLDGYLLFDRIGTNVVFFSHINNGLAYNALDYFSATVSSDFVIGCINQQQNLLVFGQKTIETWYDSGDNINPFQRYNSATIERGCAAPLSIVKEDNAVFFLGNDRIAYRLDMPTPHRISTPAIEQEWQTYSTVADCFVFKVTFEGHKFLFFTFVAANKTWVFDIETGLWHERVSYLPDATSLGRWRGNCSEVFNGVTLVGDAYSPNISELSSVVYTESGVQMLGLLTSPPVHLDRKRVFMDTFELDIESGVGLSIGQGSDPQMMLDWSDDGGRTFKPLQQWKTMGKIGEYLTRLRWTRLGQFRQRILRITVSDPVRRTIMSAHADLSQGDS